MSAARVPLGKAYQVERRVDPTPIAAGVALAFGRRMPSYAQIGIYRNGKRVGWSLQRI